MTEPTVPVIGLDMDEAIELIEILEDLSAWIHDAPAEVKTSWQRHTGGTYSAARLRTSFRIDVCERDWIVRPWCVVIEQNVQPPKQPRIIVTESLIISNAGIGSV